MFVIPHTRNKHVFITFGDGDAVQGNLDLSCANARKLYTQLDLSGQREICLTGIDSFIQIYLNRRRFPNLMGKMNESGICFAADGELYQPSQKPLFSHMSNSLSIRENNGEIELAWGTSGQKFWLKYPAQTVYEFLSSGTQATEYRVERDFNIILLSGIRKAFSELLQKV